MSELRTCPKCGAQYKGNYDLCKDCDVHNLFNDDGIRSLGDVHARATKAQAAENARLRVELAKKDEALRRIDALIAGLEPGATITYRDLRDLYDTVVVEIQNIARAALSAAPRDETCPKCNGKGIVRRDATGNNPGFNVECGRCKAKAALSAEDDAQKEDT